MPVTDLTLSWQASNVVELSGLLNELTGLYLNGATVTLESLEDQAGVVLTGTGLVFPLVLDYVTGSNGVYRATLPANLSTLPGKVYRGKVKVDAGGGLQDYRELRLPCRVRGAEG